MSQTPLVALVGNPNAGKSALFNALTGARQKVGNYPGVTVERHAPDLSLHRHARIIADLLARTGERVEQGRFSGIGIADQRDHGGGVQDATLTVENSPRCGACRPSLMPVRR